MQTSVKHSIEDRWDVTGDDGTSRFSLVLLRIMTTAFFVGTIGFLVIVLDIFESANLPIKLQKLHMVSTFAIGFILFGLGVSISIHPMFHRPSKP